MGIWTIRGRKRSHRLGLLVGVITFLTLMEGFGLHGFISFILGFVAYVVTRSVLSIINPDGKYYQ